MTRILRLTAFAVACAILCATGAILAAPAKDELTFSASLVNPDKGETAWAATGEYLIGVLPHFIIGPSLSMFDTGPTDGTAFGLAGELGFQKSGLFVGGALHALGGDAKDAADYTGEIRAGLKFGGERGFVKLTAAQVWAQNETGERTPPEGTTFTAGLGLRF